MYLEVIRMLPLYFSVIGKINSPMCLVSYEFATPPVEIEAQKLTIKIAVKQGNPNAEMEFERYVFETEEFLQTQTKNKCKESRVKEIGLPDILQTILCLMINSQAN